MELRHPVLTHLNPDRGDGLPAGFQRYRLNLTAGLPAPLPVAIGGAGTQLLLTLASGRIRHWLDLPREEEVASGARQRELRAAVAAGTSWFAAARSRPVPCLMLVIDRQLADAWPLITGSRQVLEKGPADSRRAVAEFMLSDFVLNPSVVAGGKPGGCWIDLGVRLLGGANEFRAPMLGKTRPQQDALEREDGPLPFDVDFLSAIDAAPLGDGTPVGGIGWMMSTAHG